jgi:hypothetical protein
MSGERILPLAEYWGMPHLRYGAISVPATNDTINVSQVF